MEVTSTPRPASKAGKMLWLWWSGPPGTTPDLDLCWRAYVHRFDIEMVFPQLAKWAVRAVGGGREHVADLDLAVGDDHAVDEQFC